MLHRSVASTFSDLPFSASHIRRDAVVLVDARMPQQMERTEHTDAIEVESV